MNVFMRNDGQTYTVDLANNSYTVTKLGEYTVYKSVLFLQDSRQFSAIGADNHLHRLCKLGPLGLGKDSSL